MGWWFLFPPSQVQCTVHTWFIQVYHVHDPCLIQGLGVLPVLWDRFFLAKLDLARGLCACCSDQPARSDGWRNGNEAGLPVFGRRCLKWSIKWCRRVEKRCYRNWFDDNFQHPSYNYTTSCTRRTLCTVFIVVLLRDLRTRAFLEHIESAERARKAKESTVYTEFRLKTYYESQLAG